MTARISSIRSSRVGTESTATRSESPVPRLSRTIRRENRASRESHRAMRGSSQNLEMADERGGVYEINRSFANHLEGNVHVIRCLGVANLGNHLASFPSRGLSHKGALLRVAANESRTSGPD
jgi:hypothetical protein